MCWFILGVPGPSLEEALLSAAGKERAVAEALPPDAIQVCRLTAAACSAVKMPCQASGQNHLDISCKCHALHLVLGSTCNICALALSPTRSSRAKGRTAM